MNRRFGLIGLSAFLLCGTAASAADLPNRSRIVKPGLASIGYCPANGGSAIARLPTLDAMRTDAENLHASATAAFESERVRSSAAVTINWADMARITCGIAAGYLSTGEVNVERLNQCECNYERMKRF
jgi:hypothetical protein